MRITTTDIDVACREFQSQGSAPKPIVDEAIERLRRTWDAFGKGGRTERLVIIQHVGSADDASELMTWLFSLAGMVNGELLHGAISEPTTGHATLLLPELLYIDGEGGGAFIAATVAATPGRSQDIDAIRQHISAANPLNS